MIGVFKGVFVGTDTGVTVGSDTGIIVGSDKGFIVATGTKLGRRFFVGLKLGIMVGKLGVRDIACVGSSVLIS